MAINPGDVVEVKTDPGFTLDDAGDQPTDPDTVKLTWYVEGEPPTVWTWTGSDNNITKLDTGVFKADVPIDRVGTYHARWAGTGAVIAAEETSWVSESAFSG